MELIDIDPRNVKILLIDDTQVNSNVLFELLAAQGYSISMVSNSEDALRFVGKEMPDLILLDTMMPEIDGFEVCRKLKETPNSARVPIIFVLGEHESEDLDKVFLSGGADYISKPINQEEALARVQIHLKVSQMYQEQDASVRLIREAAGIKSTFLSRFLYKRAYDLLQVPGIIKGYTDLLVDGIGQDLTQTQQRNHVRILASADHLHRFLVDIHIDINNLRRIEEDHLGIDPKLFDVKELIASCACRATDYLPHESGEKLSIELDFGVYDKSIEVNTDYAKLEQIVVNLLQNACNLTDAARVAVEVRVTESNDLVIAVSDMGKEITADRIKRIFDEVQYVEGKTTGFGLVLAKWYAELLGGSIRVENEVGKGVTFTVEIPMVYRKS